MNLQLKLKQTKMIFKHGKNMFDQWLRVMLSYLLKKVHYNYNKFYYKKKPKSKKTLSHKF